MGFVETLMIAVGLAMDAFAVSLAAGMSGQAIGGRGPFGCPSTLACSSS